MEFTKEEIEVFKRVIKDYNIINDDIKNKINNGYNYDMLYDYIRHLSSCDITNWEHNNYFDFNYCDMCISIYSDDNGNNCYLGDTIEVWNDKDLYYIGYFNCVRELELIVKDWESDK